MRNERKECAHAHVCILGNLSLNTPDIQLESTKAKRAESCLFKQMFKNK
jgi:uncharacterized Fe-S cluster protein YjdI